MKHRIKLPIWENSTPTVLRILLSRTLASKHVIEIKSKAPNGEHLHQFQFSLFVSQGSSTDFSRNEMDSLCAEHLTTQQTFKSSSVQNLIIALIIGRDFMIPGTSHRRPLIQTKSVSTALRRDEETLSAPEVGNSPRQANASKWATTRQVNQVIKHILEAGRRKTTLFFFCFYRRMFHPASLSSKGDHDWKRKCQFVEDVEGTFRFYDPPPHAHNRTRRKQVFFGRDFFDSATVLPLPFASCYTSPSVFRLVIFIVSGRKIYSSISPLGRESHRQAVRMSLKWFTEPWN